MGILRTLTIFCEGTSIHGLGFIVNRKLSMFTRIAWSLIFVALLSYAAHQLHLEVKCNEPLHLSLHCTIDFVT